MNRYNNIYILAPLGNVTGGVELCHQLVDYLRTIGERAFVVYIANNEISEEQNVTNEYQKYNILTTNIIEDSPQNILILPEIYLDWIYKYREIQIGCWWMSVDNRYKYSNSCSFYESFCYRRGLIAKVKLLRHYFEWPYRNITKDLRNDPRIIHFYQSHYAQYHLYKKGFLKIFPLSDYINTEFFSPKKTEKENIILYNPAKGWEFTKKLIKAMPNERFIPLKGLSREQLNEIFSRAKVYIDFGHFPGKDRLFREAAINHCCIVTGKEGASFFYEDVPLEKKYKFDVRKSSIPHITEMIHYIFQNYDICLSDFEYLKKSILKERESFYQEIRDAFC